MGKGTIREAKELPGEGKKERNEETVGTIRRGKEGEH